MKRTLVLPVYGILVHNTVLGRALANPSPEVRARMDKLFDEGICLYEGNFFGVSWGHPVLLPDQSDVRCASGCEDKTGRRILAAACSLATLADVRLRNGVMRHWMVPIEDTAEYDLQATAESLGWEEEDPEYEILLEVWEAGRKEVWGAGRASAPAPDPLAEIRGVLAEHAARLRALEVFPPASETPMRFDPPSEGTPAVRWPSTGGSSGVAGAPGVAGIVGRGGGGGSARERFVYVPDPSTNTFRHLWERLTTPQPQDDGVAGVADEKAPNPGTMFTDVPDWKADRSVARPDDEPELRPDTPPSELEQGLSCLEQTGAEINKLVREIETEIAESEKHYKVNEATLGLVTEAIRLMIKRRLGRSTSAPAPNDNHESEAKGPEHPKGPNVDDNREEE